jgi:hypothetical protein
VCRDNEIHPVRVVARFIYSNLPLLQLQSLGLTDEIPDLHRQHDTEIPPFWTRPPSFTDRYGAFSFWSRPAIASITGGNSAGDQCKRDADAQMP